jgi:hypothetical protein
MKGDAWRAKVTMLRVRLHPDINPNLIQGGDDKITDHGVPVARHGHKAMCGCHLISSLTGKGRFLAHTELFACSSHFKTGPMGRAEGGME